MLADAIATFIIASTLASQPESLEVPLSDYACMVEALHFEAKGESYEGKVAVANVIMNRVRSKRFPSTVCGVVKQGPEYANGHPKKHRCQFSYWCDGLSDHIVIDNRIERESFAESAIIAFNAVNKNLKDTTNGSDHYYAHDKVTPFWADHAKRITIIENHTFVKL